MKSNTGSPARRLARGRPNRILGRVHPFVGLLLTGAQARAGVLLLGFTLVIGVVYLATVPPWQVPDEPRHMGYVRELWLAMRGQDAGIDQAEGPIISSMRAHHWPELVRRDLPVDAKNLDDIQFLQSSVRPRVAQPSTYYRLGALALYVAGQEDIDVQLYIVRSLGMLMGMCVVGAGYWTARVLFPGDRLFALMVGLFVALLPQRAFMAAGVNNDNLAILAGSLAFLSITRLAVLGPNLWRLLALWAACLLVIISKSTAWPVLAALVVLVPGALLTLVSRRWPRGAAVRAAATGFVVLLLMCFVIVEPGGNAAAWVKKPEMLPSRVAAPGPAGPFAIRVSADATHPYNALRQTLPPDVVAQIAGKPLTVGAWVRLPPDKRPVHILLSAGQLKESRNYDIGEEWTFVADSWMVPDNAVTLEVVIPANYFSTRLAYTALFKGVVAVVADLAQAPEPPTLLDNNQAVLWDGHLYENLVVNGSATYGSISFRAFLATNTAMQRLRIGERLIGIEYLLDRTHYAPADVSRYGTFLKGLFDSFWGQFGWMGIRLPDLWYAILRVMSGLGFGLATILLVWWAGSAWDTRRSSSTAGVALALVAVLCGFGSAFLRQIPALGGAQGRYALPVVVPFMLVLCFGLMQVPSRRLRPWLALGTACLLTALNLASLELIAMFGNPS